MKMSSDQAVNSFLRTYRSLFTVKDFARFLVKIGIRAGHDECEAYLDTDPNVFPLKNGLYVTRAGVFTDQYFSIRPTRREIEQGVFVAGSRCMPFVDPDIFSSSLVFSCRDIILPKKTVEFDSGDAEQLFSLYGDEYSAQYIASDPANEGLRIADNDFMLPPKVKLTSFSLEPLIKYYGFKPGDRLLCKVTDWDKNIIDVIPIVRAKDTMQIQSDDLERQTWYARLEKAFLESFNMLGPCDSIEEQLALVFLDNSKSLCTYNCGSVEEFLLQSRQVSIEPFGIESRLWRANEDVPAVGEWNSIKTEMSAAPDGPDSSEYGRDYSIPDYLIDACIEDCLYKKQEINSDDICRKLFPEETEMTARERSYIRLHINSRHDIIEKSYNWFADFSVGPIRSQALQLYFKVSELVFSIDATSAELAEFPQQALVIVSQIFSHVSRIIEMLEIDPVGTLEEDQELVLSMEGMEFNFESVYDELGSAIDKCKRKGFEVTK